MKEVKINPFLIPIILTFIISCASIPVKKPIYENPECARLYSEMESAKSKRDNSYIASVVFIVAGPAGCLGYGFAKGAPPEAIGFCSVVMGALGLGFFGYGLSQNFKVSGNNKSYYSIGCE